MVLLKGIVVWLVMMAAESLHGTIRTLWLAPSIGDLPARQVSCFTGSLLLLAIATLFVRWLHASRTQLFGVGVLWVLLTLVFELSLGRLLGYPWERILADYNVAQGGFMTFGLLILGAAPFLATQIHNRLISRQKTA